MSPLKCSTCGLLALLLGVMLTSCAPIIHYGQGDPTYFGPKRSGVWMWGDDGSGRDPCPAPHVWMAMGEWYEVAGWHGPLDYTIDDQPAMACITRDVFERGVCSGNKPIQGRAWEPVIMQRSQLEQLGIVVQTDDIIVMLPGGDPAQRADAFMEILTAMSNPNRPVAISITDLQSVVCTPIN